MKCLRPHEWADFARGNVSVSRSSLQADHLQSCAACQKVLHRVEAAQRALKAVGDLPPPELGNIRTEASLRWRQPPARTRFYWMTGLGLAASTAALLLFFHYHAVPKPVQPTVIAAMPAPPAPFNAVVTLLSGDVELERGGVSSPLLPTALIAQGDRLMASGSARVAVQWSELAGVLLKGEPKGDLRFEKLSREMQALALPNGQIDVRVSATTEAGETLTLTTARHLVTVHSSWFVVAADSEKTVIEVLEGTVEVTDLSSGTTTTLRAPVRAVFGRGQERTEPLSAQQTAKLRVASEFNLLKWSPSSAAGPQALLDKTGLLDIDSTLEGNVSVDGIGLGRSPLTVRRPLGRHFVEFQRPGYGTLRRWIDVGRETAPIRLTPLPLPPPPPGDLPAEMQSMVKARWTHIRACYERQLKRDLSLSGSVSIKIRIGEAGQVTAASLEHSTLKDAQVSECLLQEVKGWAFAKGRNATLVYPFVFRAR